MRPPYELSSSLAPDELQQRLARALAAPQAPCHGSVSDHQLELMARGERHFWSPQLRARIEPDHTGARIRGRFGPQPAVWTMFAVIYIHLAFIGAAGLIYATAQLALGRTPTAALAVPIVLVLAALVRVIARIGENLGSAQMDLIRRFVARALDHDAGTADPPGER